MKANSGERIKSVDTMFSILEVVRDRNGVGVTELANELDMSKSTAHTHLKTLVNNRCLNNHDGKYHMGIRFLNFGGYARKETNLLEMVKPEVDRLAEETGETVQMLVEEHGKGIYIYQVRGDKAVKTDSFTGTEVYLHCTAVGKAILAYLPEERVNEILGRHGLPKQTPDTVSDREVLMERLEAIRERGFAFDEGERIDGIRCVGVPIVTDDGDVIGGISLTGPRSRMNGEWYREDVPELIKQATRVIEINATYS